MILYSLSEFRLQHDLYAGATSANALRTTRSTVQRWIGFSEDDDFCECVEPRSRRYGHPSALSPLGPTGEAPESDDEVSV